MKPTLASLSTQIEALSQRVAHLEDELVHQKRINMLILKGKYGPNSEAPSTPHKELSTRAKDLAKQGHKVVVRGGMLYVDGQLAQ